MNKLAAGSGAVVLGLAVIAGVRMAGREPVSDQQGTPQAESRTALNKAPTDDTARTWQPLFNHRDLTGWQHWRGGRCSVQDGLLVLENDAERRPGYLVSDVTARDFIARFRCKVVTGDSGFFFRGQRLATTPTEMTGPQVQLNLEPQRGLGGIFELHGRGWVRKTAPALNAELLQGVDWLDCELTVRGQAIRVVINGKETVAFDDPPPGNKFCDAGHFAWQIHGGGFCRVLCRDLEVLILD